MAEIGKFQTLEVVSEQDFGLYLDAGDLGEILLPGRYVPNNIKQGDELRVFIYLDSEDRLIATTETPMLQAGEIGLLRCVDSGSYGAFLDWGLPKDLLVPHREMQREMEKGFSYLVLVYVDTETNRLVATSRLDRHLSIDTSMFQEGEEVSVMVGVFTDIGCKVIVNNHCWGLLYANEIFKELKKGDTLTAYVKKIREDGKLDLTIHKPGYEGVDPLAGEIMDMLQDQSGFLPFNDKSTPEEIYATFGMSKKNFKKAIGALYKQRLITISDDGISLME